MEAVSEGSGFVSVSAHKTLSEESTPSLEPTIVLKERIPEFGDETIVKTPLDCGIIVQAGMESRVSDNSGSSFASVSAHKPSSDEFYPPSKPSIGLIESIPELDDETTIKTPLDCGIIVEAGMESRYSDTSGSCIASVSAHKKNKSFLHRTADTKENLKPGMSGQCDILDMSQKIHDSQKAKEDLKLGMSGKYDTLALSQMIHDSQKTKSTLKKRCKWGLLILLCMGMSVLLALTSLNNKETKQFASIKDDLPQKSAFKQQKQDLSVMKKILERLKSKFLDKIDFSENCVNDCRQVSSDGNYQSCYTCEGYVSCTGPKLDNMSCPLADSNSNRYLVWDDANKTCTYNSSTC